MARRSWTDEQLQEAVRTTSSVRQTIYTLGLVPAGGNYQQINRRIIELKLDNSHFTGQASNKGKIVPKLPVYSLEEILRKDSYFSLRTLKARLFKLKLKTPKCEECGWKKCSADGRIPIELDHINGDRHDNRLHNLRILCPNCHSLKPTHRGKNKRSRGGGIGRHGGLKHL